MPTRKTIWKWKYDIALLVASACCFGLFLERSLNEDQISGIGGPIALLTQGRAERKASGTNLFVDVGPNSKLFNLDAIWVGKDGEATIKLEGNISVSLTEKTLMILKRPFKHRDGQSSLEEEIKVVKGKVQTPEGKAITPEKEALAPVVPEDFSKGKKVPIELYPKDNAVIYLRPEKDIPFAFAWPNELNGYIVIQNKVTGRRIYAEIRDQRHFAAKLEQPGSYFWQVTDADRRPMLGPYTFTVKHLDNEAAKQLLKSGPSTSTDVYW
ncbi:MAG: hypothetical protein ABI041_09315 [Bdellovibrionia bacterium]